MKSACIVGAGPGGLVAAKTLLQTGAFRVTIYEKSDRIGGIWSFPRHSQGNAYLSADTPSNRSRNTVGFSDLSWRSAGVHKRGLPMFPTAVQVGKYLDEYRNRYLPSELIQFNQTVINAERIENDGQYHWLVSMMSSSGQKTSKEFDFLVNAAGFFSEPRHCGLSLPSDSKVIAIHTSKLRSLEELLHRDNGHTSGRKILVYGSGNSAGEAAATCAFQLSSALHSPLASDQDSSDYLSDLTVCHVTPRPLHAVPPYVSTGAEQATFIPLDLQFYDLRWRSPGPISSSSGSLTREGINALHVALCGMAGDQTDLGSTALVSDESNAPYAILSETYQEFVRSGSIEPVAGRVIGLKSGPNDDTLVAEIQTADGTIKMIPQVAAVVYATGYTSHKALAFLSEGVKQKLEYDPRSPRLPVLLQQHQTMSLEVPELAFIGFYEGPYWGVMEMQARIIASRWAMSHRIPNAPNESLEELRALRASMKCGASNIPQYWFSDYVGYLEEISRDLRLRRNDGPFKNERDGIASIARFLADRDDSEEARITVLDAKRTIDACATGRYQARAAFRALQGQWNLERVIDSARRELPSGTFSGSAFFYPRSPTSTEVDLEYLYVENGVFKTTNDLQMAATRRYVYRYTESTDTLSVWFVKPDDALTVDYLFHDLEFSSNVGGKRCCARAVHLCDADHYTTEYLFSFREISLQSLQIRHSVKGPAKDYVATASFKRHPLA